MAKIGQFDTDTAALSKRILAHEEYGSNDLNEWIFSNLNVNLGDWVVDLGCGTGKQTLPLAQKVGELGSILSVDISEESLGVLRKKSIESKVDKQITTLSSNHDDIYKHLKQNQYNSIVSSYSLYYSENSEKVIQTIWNALKTGGVLFFCGPSSMNNHELKTFHYKLKGTSIPTEVGGAVFMEGIGLQITKQLFDDTEVVTFENPLRFNSAESLYDYWSSYNLYDKELDSSFQEAATKYFEKYPFFETKKRVIGVKAIKGKGREENR